MGLKVISWFKRTLKVIIGFIIIIVIIMTISIPIIISVIIRIIFLVNEVYLNTIKLLLFFVSNNRRL
jgi:hypothetical protein